MASNSQLSVNDLPQRSSATPVIGEDPVSLSAQGKEPEKEAETEQMPEPSATTECPRKKDNGEEKQREESKLHALLSKNNDGVHNININDDEHHLVLQQDNISVISEITSLDHSQNVSAIFHNRDQQQQRKNATNNVRDKVREKQRKLREQEKMISKLIQQRNRPGNCSSVFDDSDNISILSDTTSTTNTFALLHVVQELEGELDKVKKDRNSIRERLDREIANENLKIQAESESQEAQHVKSIEEELITKNRLISHLTNDLYKKLARIVELEVHLETHDVHFTNYAEEQFLIGKEALQEIHEYKTSKGDDKNTQTGTISSVEGTNKMRHIGRKSKKLIDKLLSDLHGLEKRYKQEKLNHSQDIHKMENDHHNIRRKLYEIENRLKAKSHHIPSSSNNANNIKKKTNEISSARFWKKQAEDLECEVQVYKNTIEELNEEFETEKNEMTTRMKHDQLELEKLRLENQVLAAKTQQQQLLLEQHQGSTPSSDTTTDTIDALQNRICDNYSEMKRLKIENDIKDRQISQLKKDLIELRAHYTIENTNDYQKIFRDSIISSNNTISSDGRFGGTTTTCASTCSGKNGSAHIVCPVSPNTATSLASKNKQNDNKESAASVDDSISNTNKLEATVHELKRLLRQKNEELAMEKMNKKSEIEGLIAHIQKLDPSVVVKIRENGKSPIQRTEL